MSVGASEKVDRLTFESHSVARLRSVAHLFPRGRGRRGLYILTFANGERYAGQAVNVVVRFATHQRRMPDITGLAFTRIPRGELDAVERNLIHTLERRGERLRNKVHVLSSAAADAGADLDLVMTPVDQHAWLIGDAVAPDVGERVDVPAMRASGALAFAALRAQPLSDAAIDIARGYVLRVVPRPRATEMTFWAASAMPSTNRSTWPRLLAVSVNKMETLVLGKQRSNDELMWGFVNVRRSTLIKAYGSVAAYVRPRQDWLDIADGGYESGGGDVLAVHTDGRALAALLTEPDSNGLVAAARDLALQLMRKGPTLQWRWHNFPLADRLLEARVA